MDKYYNKEGKPISMSEWAKLFENKEYKVIKQTKLENEKFVSTVWLGANHQFGEGEPLIFETMVFPNKGDYGDLDCERYPALEKAEKGHEEMCEKWKDK